MSHDCRKGDKHRNSTIIEMPKSKYGQRLRLGSKVIARTQRMVKEIRMGTVLPQKGGKRAEAKRNVHENLYL